MDKCLFSFKELGLNVINLADMSSAFSMKLWFKHRDNKSLWSEFMNAKYVKKKFPGLCLPKLTDSPICKRMFKVNSVTQENMFWHLGSGRVFFWHDHWKVELPFPADLQSIAFDNVIDNSLISDWVVNDVLDVDKLRSSLPFNLGNDIFLSTKLDRNKE